MQELKTTERILPIWINYLIYGLIGLGVYYAFSYKMTEIEYVLSFILGVLALSFSMRLEIILTENGIKYRIFPWHRKFTTIEKSQIKRLSVRTINAFSEFGGIGIRYRKGYTAYLLSGSCGIDVHFGYKKIILGISDVEKVEGFLAKNGFLK